MSETTEKFDAWGVVEVMGHRSFAGRITEQTIGGASFIRVDVPADGERPAFTKLLSAASIYAITPCAEDLARRYAQQTWSPPITIYGAPGLLGLRTQSELAGEEEPEGELF